MSVVNDQGTISEEIFEKYLFVPVAQMRLPRPGRKQSSSFSKTLISSILIAN
jgi:hypothetical protein